jgi:hypothetical protein
MSRIISKQRLAANLRAVLGSFAANFSACYDALLNETRLFFG